eukprot:TRINITY_DN1525_c0_g3_i1.p1 TRINITY_DN1525_c0_g3~~TRINITY_DN1525_c0_g3_i1.p1  ORF type:complete len:344 (+),score=110.75 TRINITY_DN1525_c0_g3_i1:115-1146(+)
MLRRGSAMARKWLAIDTDAGIDDAVGLCLAFRLAASSGYDLKLVTCVQGNCPVDRVAVNVTKCREYSGASGVAVAVGAASALDGSQLDACYFHGQDGLGDAEGLAPHGGVENAAEGTGCGVEALCTLARDAAEGGAHLTVVTLGPLTNVALALRQDPAFADRVSELIVMGGCGNGRGNATRVAEFNIYNDVPAAAEVFAAWAPRPTMTVLSWEMCVAHPIPYSAYDSLLTVGLDGHTPAGDFLARILDKAFGAAAPSRRRPGAAGAVICDAYTVAYALNPAMFSNIEDVHVEVETESPLTKGMTVVDFGTCYDGAARPRHVKWVNEMSMDGFVAMLRAVCIKA